MITNLIADRKTRLNKIQADVKVADLFYALHFGSLLSTPVSKVDERAVEDNNETDSDLRVFEALNEGLLPDMTEEMYN